MADNSTYSLTGTGISITYATAPGALEFTLDDSFRPFDGTHHLTSADLKQHALDPGAQISGSLQHTSVGRGGPRVETTNFHLFLADAPEPGESAAEYSATGVLVFADPSPSSGLTPEYRATELAGSLSVPSSHPGRV